MATVTPTLVWSTSPRADNPRRQRRCTRARAFIESARPAPLPVPPLALYRSNYRPFAVPFEPDTLILCARCVVLLLQERYSARYRRTADGWMICDGCALKENSGAA